LAKHVLVFLLEFFFGLLASLAAASLSVLAKGRKCFLKALGQRPKRFSSKALPATNWKTPTR
jgi:hypothetical protein